MTSILQALSKLPLNTDMFDPVRGLTIPLTPFAPQSQSLIQLKFEEDHQKQNLHTYVGLKPAKSNSYIGEIFVGNPP